MNQPEQTQTEDRRGRGRALLAIAAIGVAGVLVAGCGDDDDTADGGSATTAPVTDDTDAGADGEEAAEATTIEIVSISDGFQPDSATVAAGTEVTWVNTDDVVHTATAEDDTWDSGDLPGGERFSFTPEEPGTYSYVCTIHPSMTAELVVE